MAKHNGAVVYLSFEQLVDVFYKTTTIIDDDPDVDRPGIPFLHEKILKILQRKIDSGEITKDDLNINGV